MIFLILPTTSILRTWGKQWVRNIYTGERNHRCNNVSSYFDLFKSSFVWALVATTLTWLLAQSLNYPDTNIQNGLYGFSAVLTAIALQNMKPIIFPLIGIVLTVFVTQAFILSGWPSLTAPFVFVSWLITIIHFDYVKYSNQSTTLD